MEMIKWNRNVFRQIESKFHVKPPLDFILSFQVILEWNSFKYSGLHDQEASRPIYGKNL